MDHYGAYHNGIAEYDLYDRVKKSTLRVRNTLFPGFPYEPLPDSPSFLDQLAGPCSEAQYAVIDLLNAPDEMELLGQTVQDCILKLRSRDPIHIREAIAEIYNLAHRPGIVEQIAADENLIKALINALNDEDPAIQASALKTLAALSAVAPARFCIFRSGGIKELVRMLGSPNDGVRRYAVQTLHKLLQYVENAKEDVISCRGLEAFIPLLGLDKVQVQALVADCCFYLLHERPHCKSVFFEYDGNNYLVKILRTSSNYLKAVYAVLRCLLAVSTEANNKARLVDIGCLEALHVYLDIINDPKWRLTLLNTIRNLSDAATAVDTLGGLVSDLLLMLRHTSDDVTVSCICGILSNLTCNNVNNKKTVTLSGGIEILVGVGGAFSHIEDVTEPTLCTIRHCTIRHDLADQAQTQLCHIRQGLQIVLCLLATRRPPIVKAALGVARNCSIIESNRRALLMERTPTVDGVVDIALEVLSHSGTELLKDFDALTEGVSLLELVETTVSLLHQLVREVGIAEIVYNHPEIMRILVSLISMDNINQADDCLVMREVMGLFYHITKSPEGCRITEQSGAVPFISYAYRSRDQAVAAYAKVILRQLGMEERPLPGYQHNSHSSTDTLGSNGRIVQQEYRGPVGWVNEGLEPELYQEFFSRTLGEMKHDHVEGQHGNSWFDTDL
ncbi:unnamed protein product [Bursaphelenchus xylophilus]|uniref:(pine wood nematode) hypothetical protein n=1 Tax=Bursaphelenchus xylophilus TaxID=6326 RepID=A0A1I7RKZ5_BURXY|nr:unnamed protein product [Bursaphelenchus xylophilus]CAG9083672.1 unnamed protein product [Bursaphelenchus xylophilus]